MKLQKKETFSYVINKYKIPVRIIVNIPTGIVCAKLEDPEYFHKNKRTKRILGSFMGRAKCHPNDNFNIRTGALIARYRLMRQVQGYIINRINRVAQSGINFYRQICDDLWNHIPPVCSEKK